MGAGHDHSHDVVFDGSDINFRRALIAVIFINLAMFVTEMIAGEAAKSQSLHADALDFFADGITYSISLWAIGKTIKTRANAAMVKGLSLLAMALWVFGSTVYDVFVMETPHAKLMGGIAVMALIANLLSVLLLMKWRNGDSNIRSVWLCSRNDAIGNIAVMIAALGVFQTNTAWPDLIVAGFMASLFINSSYKIIRQSLSEQTENHSACAHGHDSAHSSDHHHHH